MLACAAGERFGLKLKVKLGETEGAPSLHSRVCLCKPAPSYLLGVVPRVFSLSAYDALDRPGSSERLRARCLRGGRAPQSLRASRPLPHVPCSPRGAPWSSNRWHSFDGLHSGRGLRAAVGREECRARVSAARVFLRRSCRRHLPLHPGTGPPSAFLHKLAIAVHAAFQRAPTQHAHSRQANLRHNLHGASRPAARACMPCLLPHVRCAGGMHGGRQVSRLCTCNKLRRTRRAPRRAQTPAAAPTG
jgi:hypothetical protein